MSSKVRLKDLENKHNQEAQGLTNILHEAVSEIPESQYQAVYFVSDVIEYYPG
jgi:hypothetical protein